MREEKYVVFNETSGTFWRHPFHNSPFMNLADAEVVGTRLDKLKIYKLTEYKRKRK